MSAIVTCVRTGIAGARQQPLLTAITYLSNAILASVVALPSFAVLAAALAHSRESARALGAFNLSVLWQVFHYDRSPVAGAFFALAVGLLLAWLVVSALVAAGVVRLLLSGPDPEASAAAGARARLSEFFASGAGLLGRYVRLALITLALGGIVEFVLGIATAPLLAAISNSSWEASWIVATVLGAVQIAVVAGVFALVQDYARIELALSGRRSALRAWWLGLRYLLRRPLVTCAIRVLAAVALAIFLTVSLLVQGRMPAATWVAIVLLVVVQQATMIGRAALRVAEIGAEVALTGLAPELTCVAERHNPAAHTSTADSPALD